MFNKIDVAINLAVSAHRGQYRKGDVEMPYIVHPIEVMKRVVSYGVVNEEVLQAAVLHDVVEDTPFTLQDILNGFGKDVANMVDTLTKPDDLSKEEEFDLFSTTFKYNDNALIIKIADRVCNVTDYAGVIKTRDHASTYALRAYPICRQYVINNRLGDNENILNDLNCLDAIVKAKYPDIDMLDPNIEDKVRKILFK